MTPARAILALPIALLSAAGCGRPVLTVDDAIVRPDGRATLVAYVEREPLLGLRRNVKVHPVRFLVGDRELGTVHTDEDAAASLQCTLDGADATEFAATTELDGQTLRHTGSLFRWDPRRVTIAVDIDNTLSRTDADQLIFESGPDPSPPALDSAEALRTVSTDFLIVYVTARPRFLLDKTRAWLRDNGYPPGPVITSTGVRDILRRTKFKRKTLAALQRDWPLLLVGIGNSESDAEAYGATGMLTLIVRDVPPREVGRHAVVLPDWRMAREFFAENRTALLDPASLHEAIRGERLLMQPVRRYRSAK